jgi:hypothetical protein
VHGLLQRYDLVIVPLLGGLGLVVEPDIFQILQRLDQALILLYVQDYANALAVLVDHVTHAHRATSLSL